MSESDNGTLLFDNEEIKGGGGNTVESSTSNGYIIVDGTPIRVYNDSICDVIDNYNCSAYYEPSYVIARAYQNGGF